VAWSRTSLSADVQAAIIAGKPFLCGTNAVESRVRALEWSTSGLWSNSGPGGQANVTEANFPTRWMHDRYLHLFSRPSSAASGASTLYILMDLVAGTTGAQVIDTGLLALQNGSSLPGTITASLQVADDGEYSTNLATVAVFNADDTRKLIAVNFGAAFHRYTSAQFWRWKIETDDAFTTVMPHVSEVMLSRRRQLAHKPRMPFAPEPRRSVRRAFVSDSQIPASVVLAQNMAIFPVSLKLTKGAVYPTIDEAAELLAFFEQDTAGGTEHFLFVDQPLGAGAVTKPMGHWLWMPEPELFERFVSTPRAQEVELEWLELPPFEAQEFPRP
jgi:hypothetical protein